MPELPDILVYKERLAAKLVSRELRKLSVASPFVVRTVSPSPQSLVGQQVVGIQRMGKRLIIQFESAWVVIHLMIAGRLRWRKKDAKVPKRNGLAGFYFDDGLLLFTEASKKKRASIHIVANETELAQFERGGLDVTTADFSAFKQAITSKNRTIKRALCDPTILDGIGNAYSDEILHQAKLGPFKQTQSLDDETLRDLYEAARGQLAHWTETLRAEVGDGFPEKVTAFRPDMAVHGKFGEPCPVCEKPVQRVRYADNELNYCAVCQTEGKLLSDRSLARLLKDSWPKKIE